MSEDNKPLFVSCVSYVVLTVGRRRLLIILRWDVIILKSVSENIGCRYFGIFGMFPTTYKIVVFVAVQKTVETLSMSDALSLL